MDFIKTYRGFEHGAREGMSTNDVVRLLRVETPLAEEGLKALFDAPDWPLDLLDNLLLPDGSEWLFTRDGEEERAFAVSDRDAVIQACGLKGAPRGCFRLTWWIRKYAERSSHIGCADWLRNLAERNAKSSPLASLLTRAISDTAHLAEQAGYAIAVEQLTMVVGKDPTSPSIVLTPHIHADEYYGAMESAISSFFSEADSKNGVRGTMFFPGLVAGDLGANGRIVASEFRENHSSAKAYTASPGEFLIYDGMQSNDGKIDLAKGLPHVSGDRDGHTCRLVILMRFMNGRGSALASDQTRATRG